MMQQRAGQEMTDMLFEPTGDLWKDYSAYCEIGDKVERDDLVDAMHVIAPSPPPAAAGATDAALTSPAAVVPTPAATGKGAAAAAAAQQAAQLAASQAAAAAAASAAAAKVQTHITARNLEYCLGKRDAIPLANAIPHCHTLTTIQFTGCGITEHSLKLFVEAVYKSPSVVTFSVDFNPDGLYKDPTVSKKDKNEIMVNPVTYRSNHQRTPVEEVPTGTDKKGGKGGAEKSKAAAGGAAGGAAGAAGAAGKGGLPAATAAASLTAADLEPADKTPFALPTGWSALLYTGIQQLSLRGNSITDRQVQPLCDLLETNTELVSLSLWGNSLTRTGAASLAKALRTNRRLTALNVGHNQLDDEGLKILTSVFLTADVTNEEAAKLRWRSLRQATQPQPSAAVLPVISDLPPYPSYSDMFIVPGQPEAETTKKEKGRPAAKNSAKGGKGSAESPAEKLKGEFDRDVIRVDEGHVRVPGNTSLWALNLSNNALVTESGLRGVADILRRREQASYEVPVQWDGTPPPHYCVPSLALERLDVAHTGIDASAVTAVRAAVDDLTAQRAAVNAKAHATATS